MREAEKPGDEAVDITPKDFAVRTVAQEYGGGAFTVSGDAVVFANYKDQRLYKQFLDSNGQFIFSTLSLSYDIYLCVCI